MKEILNEVKFDEKGLIPVIVQDFKTDKVLMMAYMNKEALEKSLNTGFVHYWSRSRGKLWLKGETSGHFQRIKSINADCDGDTLLIRVEQEGAACHTGHYSCFYRQLADEAALGMPETANLAKTIEKQGKPDRCFSDGENIEKETVGNLPEENIGWEDTGRENSKILHEVYEVIKDRMANPKEDSYTSSLFRKGLDRILKKVAEEAGEVIIAAKNRDRNEIIYEVADLLYHLFVLMVDRDLKLGDIYAELKRRRQGN